MVKVKENAKNLKMKLHRMRKQPCPGIYSEFPVNPGERVYVWKDDYVHAVIHDITKEASSRQKKDVRRLLSREPSAQRRGCVAIYKNGVWYWEVPEGKEKQDER